ncbi:hypothetical protein M0802_005545 [Mischocyttarus mexicanus]|nr:hypothetical protein M0802_005545 [Mischocyttarus mexicanus]
MEKEGDRDGGNGGSSSITAAAAAAAAATDATATATDASGTSLYSWRQRQMCSNGTWTLNDPPSASKTIFLLPRTRLSFLASRCTSKEEPRSGT